MLTITSIAILFYNLPEAKQQHLAQETCRTHILEETATFYGKLDWQNYLGIGKPDSLQILRKEIALGLKVGTDVEKTNVPFRLFEKRSRQLKNIIYNMFPELQFKNPFMSGFKRELANIGAMEDGTAKKAALRACLLQRAQMASQLDGLPAKVMRGILNWYLI